MAFDIDIGFASQAGRKPLNEDFCAALLPSAGQEEMGSIVAIADGVSAGGMGREAAQTTATSLVRDYFGTPETWDTTVALDRIIAAQNAWLCGINRRRQPAMGLTTLTALVLRGHTYTLAHVGDTRCYLVRDGRATQLTQDHVVNHPDFKHQLLRSVGAQDHLVVDYVQGDVQVGDVFILLTDGVHGEVPTKRLPEYAAMSDAHEASQKLVAQALAKGSHDNVSAIVVRVRGLLEPTLSDASRVAHSLPIPARLKVGDTLDGLVMTHLVADSGINVLYQMRDPATQTLYAFKTLSPARAHDQEERVMLAHEAWLAERMQSSRGADHLVTVHARLPNGRERSAFYVLYDWHSGETLQQLLDRQSRMGTEQALGYTMQALKALARLHRQGVVHRDIKPANLHLGDDGVLRVLDLGVALSGREPAAMRALHAGTPSYVNPEQWGFRGAGQEASGDPADEQLPTAQSDLFALGVTLYQLLTGKLPYGEVLPYQVGRYHRDPTSPSRHNPEVPMWLNHVVLKAVALDQRQRFETAEEFLLALERGASRPLTALHGTPLMQRDPSFVWKLATGTLGLINLLLVYWLLFLPK
ncbi:MAG: bifunctional protein-serine/threonine kinase/phosphatase [Rhodoferax sp.]|uniref:bifunctional protein-serine/threonine kinase/phosphatase n=1 Tax=Rhodoferax sp. TaxID=50421 RepID=UPI002ACE385B|nr:bifunctional protein-serine/threonine kinase/phosphatase [Rhodoferax sp.]MDZ7892910.1 bifunctional protein-serine/threonine kinase/phosphatase [Rhodoferax sp.]